VLSNINTLVPKFHQLAEQVGISPTSISKIINGVTRPRQSTLTRMIQTLCRDQSEQQLLLRAFTGAELFDQAAATKPNNPTEQELQRLRAEQFLERRTQAIQFKSSVARELDKAGIAYQQDYCQGPYSTDFLIEKDGQRIALECKADAGREMKHTMAMASIVKEMFECRVIVITLFLSQPEDLCINKYMIEVVPLSTIKHDINVHRAQNAIHQQRET
jgi:transcriptional regulator with XRE-family HTH domain